MSDETQDSGKPLESGDAIDADSIMDQNDIDKVIGSDVGSDEAVGEASDDETPLDNSDLDDVLGDPDPAPEPEPEAATAEAPVEEDAPPVSSTEEIGSENVAAGAAPDAEELLDQNLIDSLISEAESEAPVVEELDVAESADEMALRDEDWGSGSSEDELPPPAEVLDVEPEAEAKASRLPNLTISFVGFDQQLFKLAASLMFGILCGLGAFSWLVLNQHRFSGEAIERASGEDIIRQAVASAEGLVEDGLYERAAMELDAALAAAPNATNRADAEYWQIKSAYFRHSETSGARETEQLLGVMAKFAEESADHPRVTEVLRWRGDLYLQSGIPLAALGEYNDLLTNYVAPLDGDQVLLAAGKAALELDRPQQAADYLRRLREEYPASRFADEAGLYQADAYAMLGSREKADLIYQRIAVSNPAARIGGQAYARMAQLSYDEGDYDEAIALLETRLATATTTDGNEDAYLLLARSLRATGDLEEAERVLRELTQFFPENDRSAEALVELSQIIEARGRRPEAANIARQAAQRFPKDSGALENAAAFLAQAGDERGAAESLLEAEAAGAENPSLLLNAARNYANTGESKKAQRTYEQLLEQYGESAEAFDGRIELAGIYFDQGKVQKSIDWLQDLAEVHADSANSVPVLLALSEKYDALGLRDRAAEAHRSIAAVAGEQSVLAQAATALLLGSDVESGLAAAHQVDPDRLPSEIGYPFLRAHGLALRNVDGRRALAQLERAYFNFPDERKPEDAVDLLESYLAADRTGAARALVMDLDTLAKSDITVAATLAKAAVLWGDHLFERRDFRAAAEAYALAESAVVEEGDPLVEWAKLQHANALLQLRDTANSAPLLAEVSSGGTAWSSDAAVREAYAEIERRLAHEEPVKRNGD